MPVEFAAVVRVNDALTFFDEIDKVARFAEFPVLGAIEAPPNKWGRNAPSFERISLGVCRPNFATISALSGL